MSSADPGVWQASPPLHGTLVLVRPARFAAVLVCAAIAGGSGCSERALEADESAVVCPVDDPDCDRIDEPCVMDETPAADLEPGSSPMGLGGPLTGGGKHQIWPKGRVPYKVGSTVNSTTKSRLLSAMKEWETKTKSVVRFEAATSADKAHVLVSEGSPRVAFVGYRAGTVSNLYLRDSEYLTVTRHELGHVLGLEHEHRRKDRANQIQVISSNIVNTSLCKYQFALCTDCALLDKYTVKSVMHYRSTRDLTSCRVGGKAVLLTKSGALINHEWLIATGDIESIYELYGSPDTGSGGTGGSKDAGLTGGTGGTADAGASDAAPEGSASGGTAGVAGAAGAGAGAGDDGIDEPSWAGASALDGAAGSGAGGGQSTRLVANDEGGCSCRAVPERSSGGWWLLVVGAAIGLLRSERRRRC